MRSLQRLIAVKERISSVGVRLKAEAPLEHLQPNRRQLQRYVVPVLDGDRPLGRRAEVCERSVDLWLRWRNRLNADADVAAEEGRLRARRESDPFNGKMSWHSEFNDGGAAL